jgi:hypothetical protein
MFSDDVAPSRQLRCAEPFNFDEELSRRERLAKDAGRPKLLSASRRIAARRHHEDGGEMAWPSAREPSPTHPAEALHVEDDERRVVLVNQFDRLETIRSFARWIAFEQQSYNNHIANHIAERVVVHNEDWA